MKRLGERLDSIRQRHGKYGSTYEMADALVPMIREAEDMVARIKELEEALQMTLKYVRHGSTTYMGDEYAIERKEQSEAHEYMRAGIARAILNKK